MAEEKDRRPHGHAVENGVIQFLSVSQILKFYTGEPGGCNRKWYFNKVLRIPEPDSKHFEEGKRFHTILENHLLHGIAITDPALLAGAHLIPEAGPDLWVEHEITGLSADGFPLVGRMDWGHRREEYLTGEGELRADPPGTIEIGDWKSTSDLRYAKTANELARSIQMVGYAESFRRQFPELTHARLSHVYFQKRKPRSCKVTVLVPVAEIASRWQAVEHTVSQMRAVVAAETPDDVEPNYAACSAYGGCCYRSICPRSKTQALTEIFGGKHMGLADKLSSLTTPAAPKVPEVLKNPTAPLSELAKTAIADQNATVAEEMAKLQEEEKAIASFGGVVEKCSACGASLTPSNMSRTPSGKVKHIGCPKAILPPDAPASGEASPAALAIPAGTQLTPAVQSAAEAVGAASTPAVPATVTAPEPAIVPAATAAATPVDAAPLSPPPAPAPSEPAPRRRGRPAKAPEATPPPAPMGLTEPARATGLEPAPDAIFLFVDVVVEGLDLDSLDPYVAEVCETIRAHHQAIDLRCAPKGSDLAYGGWKGVLAATVKAAPPRPGAYVLRDVGESEIKQVVVEALKPLCSAFVRGV